MIGMHWTAFLGIPMLSIAVFEFIKWVWRRFSHRRIVIYIVDQNENLVPLDTSNNPYWVMIDEEKRKFKGNPMTVERRKNEPYQIYLYKGERGSKPEEYVEMKEVPASDEKEYVFLRDDKIAKGSSKTASSGTPRAEDSDEEG